MKTTVTLNLGVEYFHSHEFREATQYAKTTGGRAYCWKTEGRQNWLEARFSQVDVFGYVVLPKELPDVIDMPDDEEGEEDDEDSE